MADAPDTPERPAPFLAIAWCFLAGGFLVAAPASAFLWGRLERVPGLLGRVAETQAARGATVGLGLLLVLVGTWDVVGALATRRSR